MPLQRELNVADADALYAAIVDAHRGLSAEDSAALNARLVLLLATHIGDPAVVREALRIARGAAADPSSDPGGAGNPPSD